MAKVKELAVFTIAFVLVLPVLAQEKKATEFSYVGAAGCKACHMTKKSGAAYKVWQKSKHASAYATLASEKSLAIAKEKGIADPQKAKECLECHVTAFGVDAALLGPKHKMEDGVSCEACHGPGSEYKSKKVKEGIVAGTIDPASVGLITPNNENCVRCHNDKSPTFKEFDFEKMYAMIAHPKPEGTPK